MFDLFVGYFIFYVIVKKDLDVKEFDFKGKDYVIYYG